VLRLPIEQRLIHYFLAMGAQHTGDSSDRRTLSFKLENKTIEVVIIRNEEILEKGKVIETILHTTTLKKPSTALYLAAPRLLATILDEHILKTHGLGLLLFDDRRIEETIEGQITSPELNGTAINAVVPDPNLLSEFAILKTKYTQMEKTVETLREEIKTITRNATVRTTSPSICNRIDPQPSPQPYVDPTNPSSLPSFFNNNPWLEVLSRRGRTEELVAPLAG